MLLILLSCAAFAQDKPADPPKSTPELQKLLNEGELAIGRGQYAKAIEILQKAQNMAKEKGSLSDEATVLSHFGIIYSNIGQTQKSLEYYLRALPILQQVGDKIGEARTLNNIGVVYNNGGQPQKALAFYGKAFAIYEQTQDKNGEATTLNNLGFIYNDLGELQKAIDYYNEALRLFIQLGDKNGEAYALVNTGLIYDKSGKNKEALDFYQHSLSLFQQTGNKIASVATLTKVGQVYYNTGQIDKALDCYQRALPFFKQIGDKNGEAATLSSLGAVYITLGKYTQAEAVLQNALVLREYLRGTIGGGAENRQAYLEYVLPTYARLVFVQSKLKQYDRAFATLNKMKARTLLEQSHNKNILKNIPLEDRERLSRLRAQYDKLSFATLFMAGENKEGFRESRLKTEQIEWQIQIEEDALFAKYSQPAQNKVKTVTLTDVPKFLPADTALLEFATIKFEVSKKETYEVLLFVVTSKNGKPVLNVHKLPLSLDKFTQDADALRDACAAPDRLYKSAAKRLADKLLPMAVLKQLTGKKRVIICPDGAIWSVPFAPLIFPDGKHFMERFELTYAYSATTVREALSMRKSKAKGTLVLANPQFGDETRFDAEPTEIAPLSDPARNYRQSQSTSTVHGGILALSNPDIGDRTRFGCIKTVALTMDEDEEFPLSDAVPDFVKHGRFAALPGTEVEADAISKLYPDTVRLTGKNAKETNLVKMLPNYRYLHLATSGIVNDTAPMQSAIVLAAPPKGSEDDGFLTAREIAEMKLNAEMAVLSACETGRGGTKEGEGMIGLTWALFAAGVPTQVVSQWKISDNSTPELMKHFYGNLKAGQGKGKALQNAALSMMKDGKHSHPYHWASFVLFGDWR